MRIFASLEGDAVDLLDTLSMGTGVALHNLVQGVSSVLQETTRTKAPVAAPTPDRPAGGALRDSLVMQVGYMDAMLRGLDYGRYVAGGTKAHEIRPRGGRALYFWWAKMGTHAMFARVHHPGTKPNDFRWEGIKLAYGTGQMNDAFNAFWQELGLSGSSG